MTLLIACSILTYVNIIESFILNLNKFEMPYVLQPVSCECNHQIINHQIESFFIWCIDSQMDFLHNEGCQFVQGYWFSRPQSALAIHPVLQRLSAIEQVEEGEQEAVQAPAIVQ